MELVLLLAGIVIGASAAFLIAKYRFQTGTGKLEERNAIIESNLKQTEKELESERSKVLELNANLSKTSAEYANLEIRLQEQRDEFEKLQQKFTAEFENLANRILEEKSRKFTEQNKANLDDILKPLSEKIKTPKDLIELVTVDSADTRCTICHSDSCMMCRGPKYACGCFCPQCGRFMHLHCASGWAESQKDMPSTVLKCPFCFFLL